MSPALWFRLLGVSGLVIGLTFLPALTQETKSKSYALLIGVKDYKRATLGELKYTENDVEQLAKVLDRAGSPFKGNVRVLTCTRGAKNKDDSPTAATIQKAVKALVKGKGNDDTVLVALAGHGIQLIVPGPKASDKEKSFAYFCPQDADLVGADYETGRHDHLVLLSDLLGDLGDCGAGTKLLLMDACRNERTARSLRLNKELVPDGVAALFSCKTGQFAYETNKRGEGHGVFFYHVIEALKGEAKDNRGRVTWGRLVEHVTDSVVEDVPKVIGGGAKQTPHEIKNFAGNSPVLVSGLSVAGPLDLDGKNTIGMKLVKIDKGTFQMGAGKDDDAEAYANEGPRHKVKLTKDFFMQVTEVTQGQFEKLMGYNPSCFSFDGKGDGTKYEGVQPAGGKEKVKAFTQAQLNEFPVENVSYTEAVKFCEKLNEREKKTLGEWKYSLPTEAQWEYSCRGGAASYKKYHIGDTISKDDANFNNHFGRTEKVGSYPANKFGLRDMHGNVFEWCLDWFDKYPDGEVSDPSGPLKGSYRVLRGGGWSCSAGRYRSAFRYHYVPESRSSDLGFRVALVPAR